MDERLAAWFSRMDDDDRERIQEEWRETTGSSDTFETRFRLRWFDDNWHWVSSRAVLRGAADGTSRWFGVFTDISRQMELEEQIAQLAQPSSSG